MVDSAVQRLALNATAPGLLILVARPGLLPEPFPRPPIRGNERRSLCLHPAWHGSWRVVSRALARVRAAPLARHADAGGLQRRGEARGDRAQAGSVGLRHARPPRPAGARVPNVPHADICRGLHLVARPCELGRRRLQLRMPFLPPRCGGISWPALPRHRPARPRHPAAADRLVLAAAGDAPGSSAARLWWRAGLLARVCPLWAPAARAGDVGDQRSRVARGPGAGGEPRASVRR